MAVLTKTFTYFSPPVYDQRAVAGSASVFVVRSLVTEAMNLRPLPSLTQFTGFVEVSHPGVPAERLVLLRTRAGAVIASTWSDPVNGYFIFRGWYPVRDDYEIEVKGDDYQSKVFLLDAPAGVEWNGNPAVFPSDV
jgi:hypothetical protein